MNIKSLTVVITNFNRPQIILPVLDSIFNQDMDEIELDVLVIDDCSDESINPIDVQKYGDKLQIIKLSQNKGLHGARNEGIKNARSNFILIADDDDLFYPNSLLSAIKLIEALPNAQNYPVFQFRRSNGIMQDDFVMVTEQHYYEHLIKGDFTPIINRDQFYQNSLIYPEFDDIRKISCENLLWADIGNKFGIPTWSLSIIKLGEDASIRLTNSDNWLKKSNQFARLQKYTISFMESRGFDKKYVAYYNSRVIGFFIYSLLSDNRGEARKLFKKKYRGSFLKKKLITTLSIIPKNLVFSMLKLYRGVTD